MSRDSIRLDIDDQLHCDLLVERFVERGSGNILGYQQKRGRFVRAVRVAVFGLFLQPR
jgi:hypothetical protein